MLQWYILKNWSWPSKKNTKPFVFLFMYISESILSAVIKIAGLIVKTEEFDYFKQICINNWEFWMLRHFYKSQNPWNFATDMHQKSRVWSFLSSKSGWEFWHFCNLFYFASNVLKIAPRNTILSDLHHKRAQRNTIWTSVFTKPR